MNNKETEDNGLVGALSIIHIIIYITVALHLIYLIFMIIKQNCFKNTIAETHSDLRKINETCSICLENISLEVQLLCSHSYCANCIISYGKQRFDFNNIECPMCRKASKLLFCQFERTDENKDYYDYNL